MTPLLVSKNMNMDVSVSSNESVNGTETMKYELKKIENKKNNEKNPAFRIRFSILGEL